MLKQRYIAIGIACVALLLNCAAGKINYLPNGYDVINIQPFVPKKYENHPDVAYCKNFILTAEQVKQYFAKAKVILQGEYYMYYNWLPCYVKGEIKWEKNAAKFEINAMQKGMVKFSDGREVYVYCGKPCEDMFLAEQMRAP